MHDMEKMIIYESKVDSSFQSVHDTVNEIMQHFSTNFNTMGTKTLFKINFLLRELLNNAVEHGNQFHPDKQVVCRILRENDFIVLEVIDEGLGIESDLNNLAYDVDTEDIILRERNRGLQLLKEMSHTINISGNQIKVHLALNEEDSL